MPRINVSITQDHKDFLDKNCLSPSAILRNKIKELIEDGER